MDRVVIIDLALLLDGGTDPFERQSGTHFDDFAAADVNDDGILTGPELGAAVCRTCEGRQRLNDKVRGRGFSVFVTK